MKAAPATHGYAAPHAKYSAGAPNTTAPTAPHLRGMDHINTGAIVENAARYERDGLEARIGFQRETS